MSDKYPIPVASDEEIADFIRRYGKPYDPENDTYERPPFVADIREGKNDPIYNAHSYHTKVPPRAIIPYILHYTEPGDIVLDPFCGSGMTGVAAMMCADPPEDIKALFPELAGRLGARRVILNDLSPAACHIAYNYCTPIDVDALKREFERIKEVVKDEFDWLYRTEHFEPAVGLYDPRNAEVAGQLRNLPPNAPPTALLEQLRSWDLTDRAEVEKRLGYSATQLPRDERWGDLDVSTVDRWICIPATIRFTIWSDVYKCEGMVTVEESVGTPSFKGGPRVLRRARRARGCGSRIVLWDAAVDHASGKVSETFCCPNCRQSWKKIQLKRIATEPMVTSYRYDGLRAVERRRQPLIEPATLLAERATTAAERAQIDRISRDPIPWPVPDSTIDRRGPQYNRNALSARGVCNLSDFYTRRNLRAIAALWHAALRSDPAYVRPLLFLLTSSFGHIERTTRYKFKKGGNSSLAGQLYFPSFPVEDNVLRQLNSKARQISTAFEARVHFDRSFGFRICCRNAGALSGIPDGTVDFVFADPPFGSNIYYSEVNWLYECWLGRQTDRGSEAVVHRPNDRGTKTIDDYCRLMSDAFRECFRVLKPGRCATIEFNNNDGSVFEAIKQAARNAGFVVENMVFLDKVQKTFKQIKGDKGEEDVVGHDVIFNLRKPGVPTKTPGAREVGQSINGELERLVIEQVREHLGGLPERIKTDVRTYSDEHRTTPFLNTMLMNALIPKGVNVERLNLPFIEAVCSRYFRKIDNRWYLRDEQVGDPANGDGGMFASPDPDVAVRDEMTAIEWLRRRLLQTPMRIGELRPHWMRATVQLTDDISTRLEKYLQENFWLDRQTRKWREPSDEERKLLDNADRQRARHDAERFLHGSLQRHPADAEILDWIGHLYASATLFEEEAIGLSDSGEVTETPAEALGLYGMMPRLFQAVLKERVEPQQYALAQRQCRIATTKLVARAEQVAAEEEAQSSGGQLRLFDQGMRDG